MAFTSDTAVRSLGNGRYAAEVRESWRVTRGPNGGFVVAILLHAMDAELAEREVAQPGQGRTPRSLTVHFLDPLLPGPCQIETRIERAGRSVATLSGRVVQEDRLCALALAAYSIPRESITLDETRMPQVPPPEALPPLVLPPIFAPPFAQQYEMRWALGDLPLSGSTRSVSGAWIRPAEPEPLSWALLAAMTDALPPTIFPRLREPIAAPTIDLSIHLRASLPLPDARPDDFYLATFSSSLAADGYFEEDGAIWSKDGQLLAQSRQLALLPAAR